MKPTYELRTYLVALALARLFRHPFSRSLSHSRRTRLRLAIITAPDIYRHGIRARRLISGSRLPRAPFFLLSALPPFLSASFFSSFLFPLSLSLSFSFFLGFSSGLYEVNRAYASLRTPRDGTRGSAQIQTNCAISGSW